MILVPHSTRCPACGRFVYATDPLFVAENWKGVEAIRGFVPGIYHDACFQASPHREAYLAIDRSVQNAELDKADEYLVVLGRTPRLALTLRPYTGDYQLRFLVHGRTLRFRGPQRWQEFLARIAGPDGPQPTAPADRGDVRVRRSREGWELATRQTVAIVAEFTKADFDRIRQSFAGRGVDPARTPVELGVLCRELGIAPVSVGCPLEYLTGSFTWPDVPDNPTQSFAVTVQVETWNAVPLTTAELEELRRFLLGLGRK